jgi:hypothetical protein
LSGAIRRHFQSHDEALRAAGIDPAAVRKLTPWNKDKIIELLRRRAAAGQELHGFAIAKSDPHLGSAMKRHFHSHDEALGAAGIDPSSVKVQRRWDRAAIVDALRDRREKGLGLNVHAVQSDPPLAGAIHRYFGSHEAALGAAGIDPESVRKARRPWQKEEIVTALRELARDGAVPWPLAKSGGAGVERAAKRLFGGVEAAARAAGLDYVRPPEHGRQSISHWTEELVLRTLQELHRDGHDLRYRHVKEHSQPLFFAAKQFFGSYVNAVKQAGVDYWEMSQAQLAKDRDKARVAGRSAEA